MAGKLIKRICAAVFAAVLAVGIIPVYADTSTEQQFTVVASGVQYHQTEARKLLGYINDFRTSGTAWIWNSDGSKTENIKKDALQYDYELEEIAMQRAAEISYYFSHTRPDGTSFSTCMSSNKSWSYAENIAFGLNMIDTPAAAFEAWKEETAANYANQGHRRAMLGDYEAVGAACVECDSGMFWVLEFGGKTDTADPGAADDRRDVNMQVTDSYIQSSVYYSAADISVTVGAEVEIPAPYYTVSLSSSYNQNLHVTDGIEYTVSDSSVLSVNGTKITGLKAGNCDLTAHYNGGQTYVTHVHVADVTAKKMNRLYNPNSGEHFYTASSEEKDNLVNLGWNDEGTGWCAPSASGQPVYRLYNKNGGEHHYTLSVTERDNLIDLGWSYEGIGWYSDDAKSVPLYRQYNPNAFANNHNYTVSSSEKEHLISLGWKDEGTGWYGVSNN